MIAQSRCFALAQFDRARPLVRMVVLGCLLALAPVFGENGQESGWGDEGSDPFDIDAFDNEVTVAAQVDSADRLAYLPGVFFVAEGSGTANPGSGESGTDTRFYGKAFVKIQKPDVGALYAGANFNYFLFAAANNELYRQLYRVQSPDPSRVTADLAELHFSFDLRKKVFLRVGSQLLSWGASGFWSPVDFINRQKAQPSQLTLFDNRSGKPGVRVHVPLEPLNVFLFTDFSAVNIGKEINALSQSIAQGWRIDIVLGGVQIGTVGYAGHAQPLRLGLDATGNLRGVDIYGEVAAVIDNTNDSQTDFSGNLGGARSFGREKTWSVRGEFYYNDNGYGNRPLSQIGFENFDPLYSGRAYLFGEIASTKIGTSALGASLFTVANVADGSLLGSLQLNFAIARVPPFSLFGRWYTGRLDREFTSLYDGRVVQGGVRMRAEF